MQHPDEGMIHSWLDGALSADEAARVEAHVKECPECAAAVAEARGFIAGASRILMALDNAPRGVIPAAAPKKRIDPWVLRAAATVFVVAAGTLVVFKNGGKDTQMAPMADSARNTRQAVAAAPITDQAAGTPAGSTSPAAAQPKSSGSTTGPLQRRVDSKEKSLAKGTAADALSDSAHGFAALEPGVTTLGETRAVPQATIPAREKETIVGRALGAVAEKVPDSAARAGLDTQTAQAFTQTIRIRGASARDVASAQPPLRVVGTPRAIGLKITMYEVAPGDTVTLTEPMNVRLESVVVTSMSTAASGARQSTGKSVAAKSAKRADTAAVSASDSARVSGNVATLAAPPPVTAPGSRVEVANGVTTISWADGTTGNVLKLSGRMPEARLQEIRIRIEKERAAAAAAAAKKTP
jgi:hypothetical protein